MVRGITLLVLLALPCITLAFAPRLASVKQVTRSHGRCGRRVAICNLARMTPEEEEEERQVQEELQRKIKGLYNAEGKPYAPWLLNQVDLEASARAIRARRRKEKEMMDSTGDVYDPQGQEMSGLGLKYRVVNEKDVELGWVTGEENDNVGFMVFRRRADENDEFMEIASFKTYPPLNSKGREGGTYVYVDPDVEPGQYIYRVSDQDKKGKRTILCQVGVEVQSQSEKLKNVLIVGVFGALFVGGAIASLVLDNVQ